jgi:hypothetical protein
MTLTFDFTYHKSFTSYNTHLKRIMFDFSNNASSEIFNINNGVINATDKEKETIEKLQILFFFANNHKYVFEDIPTGELIHKYYNSSDQIANINDFFNQIVKFIFNVCQDRVLFKETKMMGWRDGFKKWDDFRVSGFMDKKYITDALFFCGRALKSFIHYQLIDKFPLDKRPSLPDGFDLIEIQYYTYIFRHFCLLYRRYFNKHFEDAKFQKSFYKYIDQFINKKNNLDSQIIIARYQADKKAYSNFDKKSQELRAGKYTPQVVAFINLYNSLVDTNWEPFLFNI